MDELRQRLGGLCNKYSVAIVAEFMKIKEQDLRNFLGKKTYSINKLTYTGLKKKISMVEFMEDRLILACKFSARAWTNLRDKIKELNAEYTIEYLAKALKIRENDFRDFLKERRTRLAIDPLERYQMLKALEPAKKRERFKLRTEAICEGRPYSCERCPFPDCILDARAPYTEGEKAFMQIAKEYLEEEKCI